MGSMRESCSVCGKGFDVQFKYQMEERNGAFSFFCSQGCIDRSHGADDGNETCDACAKRFKVELVSQVMFVKGQRKHACSLECRGQLTAEARGVRLGDLAAAASAPPSVHAPSMAEQAEPMPPPATLGPAAPLTSKPTTVRPGQVVSTSPTVRSQRASQAPPAAQAASAAASGGTPSGAASNDLPKLIAVFNHKGGTGKTTTSVSLASGLAMRGKRVLLVDTDAQGNVSVSLGVKAERSLYHVLVMGLSGNDAVTNVRPNLDLIPSNETLAAAELYLAGRQNRDRVLAGRLAAVVRQYDHVVVDCSPSLSLMNQNALCLVDSVVVPVACDYLSLVGMRQVIKTVKNVNQLLHHPVRIWGVLPTFYDSRVKICNEAIDTLRQHFGPRCLRPIRQATKMREAPSQGQTIFEYAPNTTASEDYLHFVDTVLGEVPLSAPSGREASSVAAASA
jgi:chromosome partitioning protein